MQSSAPSVAESAMASLLERAHASKHSDSVPASQREGMTGEQAEVYDTLHSRLRWLREQPDHERLGVAPRAAAKSVDEAFETLRGKYQPRRYRHHGGVEVQRVLGEINELLAASHMRLKRAPQSPAGAAAGRGHAKPASDNPMFAPTPAVVSEVVEKAQRFHERGLEALDAGRARDARNLFQQALGLSPDRTFLSDLELAKGLASKQERDLDAARKHFTNALRANRDSQRARDALQALTKRDGGLLKRLLKR